MFHIDVEFIQRISPRLDRFERKATDKYYFNCPYCTDKKKRGGFYRREDNINYRCFNCDKGTTFANFLRDPDNPVRDLDLYNEYQVERFRNGERGSQPYKKPTEEAAEEIVTSNEDHEFLASLVRGDHDSTAETEISRPLTPLAEFGPASKSRDARKYLCDRGFDPDADNTADLLYTDNFVAWTNAHTDKALRDTGDDPRIVIPMITRDGVEFGAQGRAVFTSSKIRYMISLLDDRFSTCYGAHKADFGQEMWVLEGAFDAILMDNALAAMNADLSGFASGYGLKRDKTVLLFDNEPGNRHLVKSIKKAVDDDWSVAFWKGRARDTGKDVNDAVQKGHSIVDLFTVKRGMSANLELARWRGNLS